jgi:1-deoxy-D-xylulose-5-phosphate reductoisomerase
MNTIRGIAILGSTGSIGKSTLAVIGLHPDRFRVAMLGAHSSWRTVVEQALRFEPDVVVLVDPEAANEARKALNIPDRRRGSNPASKH